jgi:hypothetical protein
MVGGSGVWMTTKYDFSDIREQLVNSIKDAYPSSASWVSLWFAMTRELIENVERTMDQ